jgi:hypothetical protein
MLTPSSSVSLSIALFNNRGSRSANVPVFAVNAVEALSVSIQACRLAFSAKGIMKGYFDLSRNGAGVKIASTERRFQWRGAMLNASVVNAYSVCIIPRQNARFCAFSPENVHFKNPVKYNSRPGIN